MIRNTIFFVIVTLLAAAAAFSAVQTPAPQDPGQVTLNRACTVCHNLTEITKFKGYYRKDQWADVVRTMRADGAVVQDSEVAALVEYLFRTYGKQELPEGDGRPILEASCAGCHDLQKATSLKLTKSGWQDVVGRMIGSGAIVDDAKVPTLVDYLSKNFSSVQ